jgi:ferredoxin
MVARISENVAGRFYVDNRCINCSLCPEIAPNVFATNHDKGYEYVKQQPQSRQENRQVAEAMDLCPANAIQDNG